MCGRYALTATPDELEEALAVIDAGDFPPRYNIAPTQPILVVIASDRADPRSNLPARRVMLVRWGFMPGWVKDPQAFPLLINARAETAIEKASFRAAMRHRRILIPASGFYEWHRPAKERGLPSQAYWIRPRAGGIVTFAGVMETWAAAEGSEVDTAAILTTQANPTISAIHDRMPVVIPPDRAEEWLDCRTQEPRDVASLMAPAPDDLFEAIPVSDLVNKVANTGADIQTRIDVVDTPKATAEKPSTGQLSLF